MRVEVIVGDHMRGESSLCSTYLSDFFSTTSDLDDERISQP